MLPVNLNSHVTEKKEQRTGAPQVKLKQTLSQHFVARDERAANKAEVHDTRDSAAWSPASWVACSFIWGAIGN